MANKLGIYNGALRFLGERKTTLTEAREPRRVLDDIWDDEGVKKCLQQGQWNFAIKSAQFDYDSGIEPPFGYRRVFAKPDDFVRTAGVCSDEFFRCPLTLYQDNNSYWLCDLDMIFVRYVSDDEDYGFNFDKWPPNFTTFVEGWFALQAKPRLTGNKAEWTQSDVAKLLRDAKATDAMEEPPGQQPTGSWVRARRGNSRSDRTPSGNLY
jgi:hypothetical protein